MNDLKILDFIHFYKAVGLKLKIKRFLSVDKINQRASYDLDFHLLGTIRTTFKIVIFSDENGFFDEKLTFKA